MKARIEQLSKLIFVAQREAAKARARGANDIAESYAGVEGRWRVERDRLLKQQTDALPDENGSG